jgi:hypothetical protein
LKVRSGFVSNSSSSSFIVAYRGERFLDNYNETILKPAEGSPFAFVIQDIGTCLQNNIDKTLKSVRDYYEDEDTDRNYVNETIVKLLEEGYTVATGSISDQSDYDQIDNYLAHNSLNYKSDTLVIATEGGY